MIALGILLLFGAGLLLSALFSGSETGFYRVNRVRLVLDSRSGDRIARALLYLSNRPTLFVATVLVGNNIANNVTAMAVVLAATHVPLGDSAVVDSILPIVVSPIVFIYGELLPKYLFYLAPNRLLKIGAPLFLLCAVVLLPISGVLWVLGQLLQSLLGQTPLRVALRVARTELAQILREGQDVGILEPTQRAFTQAIVEVGPQSVQRFSTPVTRLVSVPLGASTSDCLELARRHRSPRIAVRDPESGDWVGYVRAIDLRLSSAERVEAAEPFLELPQDLPVVQALAQLRRSQKEWALLRDSSGKAVAAADLHQLLAPLLKNT